MVSTRETRTKASIQAAALKRLALWHVGSSFKPIYLVSEYPKSGGTWVTQMLSSYLDLPYPRNRPAKFEASVLHGHHAHSPRFKNVLGVLRDGRDIMVSAYYHRLFHSERNSAWSVEQTRRRLNFSDLDDIQTNLPRFIAYVFEEDDRKRFAFTWGEFTLGWLQSGSLTVSYEMLLSQPVEEMARVIESLTSQEVDEDRLRSVVEAHSFERMTGRKRGTEDKHSFIRKGVAGDWKKHFTSEACVLFDDLAGDALVAAGYEKSRQWARDFTEPSA